MRAAAGDTLPDAHRDVVEAAEEDGEARHGDVAEPDAARHGDVVDSVGDVHARLAQLIGSVQALTEQNRALTQRLAALESTTQQ